MNRVTLSETLVGAAHEDAMLPALDEALSRLEQHRSRAGAASSSSATSSA